MSNSLPLMLEGQALRDYTWRLLAIPSTMRELLDQLGSAVVQLVVEEMASKEGHPGHRLYLNYPVDAHGRALGCMIEVHKPPELALKTVVYAEPRGNFAGQPHPDLAELPHSDLN